MTPPVEREVGGIRYIECVRPMRRVCDIVRELPIEDRVIAIGEIERVVTVEGEYAALVELACERAHRTVGVVFGDDFYSLTVGIASAEYRDEIRAQVRRLVVNDTHVLGVRRRRFVHAALPGWHGFSCGAMQTQWVPLEYPRDDAMLTIFPALPDPDPVAQAAAFAELQLGGAATAPLRVETREGVEGTWWTAIAGERAHDVIVFADDRYIYPLAMQSHVASRAHRLDLWHRLATSIEAIPRSAPRAMHTTTTLAHWAD